MTLGEQVGRHSCSILPVIPVPGLDPGISHRNPAAVRLHGEKTIAVS